MSAAAPIITAGSTIVCFAADIGFGLDLEIASGLFPGGVGRPNIRERRTPSHLVLDPAPLHVTLPLEDREIAGFAMEPRAEAVLFDFGGVAILFRIPIAGPLNRLIGLSEALYENESLSTLARTQIALLAERLRPALDRPEIAPALEDYCIHHVSAFAEPITSEALLREHAATLSAILRAERHPLASQEVSEAIAQSMAYRPDDLLVLDWNAAFVVDREFEALATMLIFANVELLEMRVLDGQLDRLVDRAYESLSRRSVRDALGIGPARHERRRLARLEIESAILFEQINNSLKLFGDEYLARAYRLAARRLHIGDWEASVRRKLETVERIESTLGDEQSNRRMELLEWIIILLIAWEVVWSFLNR